MKKLLNYAITDRAGFDYLANVIRKKKGLPSDVRLVARDILDNGGLIGDIPHVGQYVWGNMWNADNGFNGEVGTTSRIEEVDKVSSIGGVYVVTTHSGSEYLLAHPARLSMGIEEESTSLADEFADLLGLVISPVIPSSSRLTLTSWLDE